jgi:hypothetical protein
MQKENLPPMMMMTSFGDVQNKLNATLGTYKNLKIMDAVLVNDRNNQEYNPQASGLTQENGYSYTSTKLAEITKQKQVQFDALKSVLEEIKKEGTVKTETLQESAGLVKRDVSPTTFGGVNDDGADAVTKNKAEVVSDFGLKDLVEAKDITKEQKQKLASAYLTQIETLNKIENNTAKPTFNSATDKNAGTDPKETLKQYASLKKDYIEAVKKGLADKVIESTDGAIDKATFGNEKPNQKFDPAYTTYVGGVKNGTPSAENTAKSEKLAKVKEQLEGIRKQFKNAGIDNVDELLEADKFEPTAQASTKLGALTEEQKKKGFTSSTKTDGNDVWKPIATKVKKTLEEQNKSSAGVTLENFTTKFLEDGEIATTLKNQYLNNGAKPLSSIDTIFSTTTKKDADGKVISDIPTEIAGAEEANRTTSLAKDNIGKPIAISTTRDRSEISIGSVKIKGIDVPITVEAGEEQVNKDSKDKSLLMSTFRGQPAVVSKKGDKYFVRFYDTQKTGTGYVLTTGIAEVDPKLVFSDKDKTKPKKEIDTNMILVDSQKRKVIDYYVRGFNKGGFNENDKVLYVARNFADNINRLESVRAAQYFAAMAADPVNFKTKTKEEPKKADEPIAVAVPGETTPALVNKQVVVTRS